MRCWRNTACRSAWLLPAAAIRTIRDHSINRRSPILTLRALCALVKLKQGNLKRGAASMTVRLKDGSEISRTVTVLKGTPDIPPTRDDVYEKFSLLTRHCPRARMEELFSRVQNLENESDLAWVAA